MVVTIMIGMVLMSLATLLAMVSASEMGQAGRSQRINTSGQAAEAAIDDYIAKLTEDHQYYAHFVHPGESTRRSASGAQVAAGGTWDGTLTWTYPMGKNAWRPLGNGYEYNVQVEAPTLATPAVRIIATGRTAGSAKKWEWKAIETLVRPASIADFQMIANRDIVYGSTATTRGELYAGIDERGTRHNISHYGNAYANLYAEGTIPRAPTYYDGAQGYTAATIRTKIKNPINFNAFTSALVEIQQVASNGGVMLNDPAVNGWKLVFDATGSITVWRCTKVGAHLADRVPSCASPMLYSVPANGAVYVGQSVVISGIVKGRVTVASNGDVVIGGDIAYNQPGTDVLGLIAKQEMIVARWVPTNLTWTAATIAQTGRWRSYVTDGSHGTMTFTGSTATNLGGYMNMFTVRNYLYDTNLLYLQPPYFPVLEEAYTVLFFREVPP